MTVEQASKNLAAKREKRETAEALESTDRQCSFALNQASLEIRKKFDNQKSAIIESLMNRGSTETPHLEPSTLSVFHRLKTENDLMTEAYDRLLTIRLPRRRIDVLLALAHERYAQASLLREECLEKRRDVSAQLAGIEGVEKLTIESADYLRLAERADEYQREGARYEREARELEELLDTRLKKGIR